MKLIRRFLAKCYKVPFRKRVWYNLMAMLPKEEIESNNRTFVEIFDKDGFYIDCPSIGGTVIYNQKGTKFLYKIVGFQNESRNRDWMYDTDYINPVIEFIKKI